MVRQTIPGLNIARIEWQTIAVLICNYAMFAAVCYFYHALPWWLVFGVGAYSVGLHGSLQHEVIHGHPTRSTAINEWLVFPALWLWLPYGLYRDSHLKHHTNSLITDPFEDPESYFVSRRIWSELGIFLRLLYWIRNTVAGRLLLGPIWVCVALIKQEVSILLHGDYKHLKYWSWHLLSVALVLFWIYWCNIPLLEYVLLFAYPGLSVTMLRSFLEHRTDVDPARRSVVIKSGRLMGLLFLNNNLHALHHEQPATPWYQLPKIWTQYSNDILSRNGGYFYSGYWAVLRRYLWRPTFSPRHPFL